MPRLKYKGLSSSQPTFKTNKQASRTGFDTKNYKHYPLLKRTEAVHYNVPPWLL